MTTRYRVEYALKSHRRDEFIEWIKGLLVSPFVLHAGAIFNRVGDDSKSIAECRRRYAEIFYDVEKLIENQCTPEKGRLVQLVPTIGVFFTKLPLERAFYVQDELRSISQRRLVAPSFNDIRLILNTAQVMVLGGGHTPVKLVTFDGDVTLYDDGMSLEAGSPVIPRLLDLLRRNIYVGIVTAAGYSEKSGEKYLDRLRGITEAVVQCPDLTDEQKSNLFIMGGESNYLFRINNKDGTLDWIEPEEWILPEMAQVTEDDIKKVLDMAQTVLTTLKDKMNLPAQVIRKYRGVGLVPLPGRKLWREALEEVVLHAQRRIELSEVARRVPFCAFNGGNDVWVDIGDKRWGVLSLQRYLGGIGGHQTLHVGDQFASIGANDFKARLAGCTVWIASPTETVEIVDELIKFMDEAAIYND